MNPVAGLCWSTGMKGPPRRAERASELGGDTGNRTPDPPARKSPTTDRPGLHGARTEVPERPYLPIVGPCYWHDGGTGRSQSPRACGLYVQKRLGGADPPLAISLDVLTGSAKSG